MPRLHGNWVLVRRAARLFDYVRPNELCFPSAATVTRLVLLFSNVYEMRSQRLGLRMAGEPHLKMGISK